MARRPKKQDSQIQRPRVAIASRDTLNTIIGIGATVLALLLIFAATHSGGIVGEALYSLLTRLFGFGYYLLTLVLFVLALSFFQIRERGVRWPQLAGSLVLFLSLLGMVALIRSEFGGLVGAIIASPLIKLFDVYAGFVILVALVLASLLVIFDTHIKFDLVTLFRKIFNRNTGKETEDEIETMDHAVAPTISEPKITDPINANANISAPAEAKRDDEFTPMPRRKSGKAWVPPPLSLLEKDRGKPGVGDIKANANLIKRTLQNFGIIVEMDEISIGPSVTRYALKPAEGVKLAKIVGLQPNLELALAAHPVRIEAPIPGKSLVGIEVPNTAKSIIGLGSLLSEEGYSGSAKSLLVALGRDIAGRSHFANLAKMPHLLVAGATGSGKSVTIHAIVNSLLFRNPPESLKFIMIDPKRVELTLYNSIPHLLTPVITDPKKAILALKWAAKEMERRYDLLEKASVRDIDSYHANIAASNEAVDPMPYLVVIIDELADLMQSYPRELEAAIVRLAQMSRAVGIHLILSTQRPSVNVITGLIKANIPARIALQVSSQIDSRTILDSAGAEKLLGQGDMLYLSGEMSKPVRIQSAFISEGEVKGVSKYLRDTYADELEEQINLSGENAASPNAIFSATLGEDSDPGDDDELYEEARVTVMEAGKASTSFLQRKLRIGYARAARLMDLLEERGVIGPGSGAKPREVIGATSSEGNGLSSNDFTEEN